jgi:hypothetical protein
MTEDEIAAIQAMLTTNSPTSFFTGVETAMRRHAQEAFTATGSTVEEIKTATVWELNAEAVRKFYSADCIHLID